MTDSKLFLEGLAKGIGKDQNRCNLSPLTQAKQTVSKPVTRKSVTSQYILSLDLGHLRVLMNL